MLTLFVVLLIWSAVATNPISQVATPSSAEQEATPGYLDDLNVDDYLRRYGYMNDVNGLSDDYDEIRTNAIRSFQEFAGLEVTGVTDEETREVMLKPRCGMKDIEIDRPTNSKWNVSTMTYKIKTYTKDVSKRATRKAVAAALTLWEGPTKMKFKRVKSGRCIMEILFVTRKHPPCDRPFDGPYGVLAHAFPPSPKTTGGDMHFDDDEKFKYKKGSGFEISSIVLHESGHSLGLSHDKTKGQIMNPWFNGQTNLGANDIKRMKALYA